MRFFEIIDAFDPKGRWYLRAPRTSGGIEVHNWCDETEPWKNEIEPWRFTTGQKFEGPVPLVIPIYQGTVPLDFTLGAQDMPVVSKRVFEHLDTICHNSVEWIPAAIPGIPGSFMILNALGIIDALDEEHSEIARWFKAEWPEKAGQYAGAGRKVLKQKQLAGTTMFRLKNWETTLFASEIVKRTLENLNVTGIQFKEVVTL